MSGMDSFNDSFTIQELKTSASISFSTHGTLLDYSSEIDIDNDNDDVNSLLKLPISPVSQSQEEEEEEHDGHEGMSSTAQEECTGIPDAAQLEAEHLSLMEAETKAEAEATSDSIPPNLPNELSISISTTQTSHCNEKNSKGQSPLSISSSNCFLDGIKLLIQRGANINLQDGFGRTALHLACANAQCDRHHACIDYLLFNGADVSIHDLHGKTPLHIAANEGCVECINKLLEHKADPNARDESGEIPLHIAARMMHLECMEALSPSCEDSTSTVESTSSILQFENDTNVYQFACDRSMTTRSMQEMTSSTAIAAAGNESWHDSGYFTARGNAWTKSKYYPSNKIEEEMDFSQSTESDSLSQHNVDTAGELSSTWAASKSLEFTMGLALYLIDFFLCWLRNHVVSKSPVMMQANNDVSPRGQEESCLSFKEPPDHIKEAMERYKQQRDMQN
jgi:hypothetical protein